MPLSAFIESDEVKSVVSSSVQGVNGVWINSDIRVFIPIDVLQLCNDQALSFSITPEEAQKLFDQLLQLRRLRPHIFNDWEIGFIDSVESRFSEGPLNLSKKQKAKIKKLHDDFSVELSNLDSNEGSPSWEEKDDIPF